MYTFTAKSVALGYNFMCYAPKLLPVKKKLVSNLLLFACLWEGHLVCSILFISGIYYRLVKDSLSVTLPVYLFSHLLKFKIGSFWVAFNLGTGFKFFLVMVHKENSILAKNFNYGNYWSFNFVKWTVTLCLTQQGN